LAWRDNEWLELGSRLVPPSGKRRPLGHHRRTSRSRTAVRREHSALREGARTTCLLTICGVNLRLGWTEARMVDKENECRSRGLRCPPRSKPYGRCFDADWNRQSVWLEWIRVHRSRSRRGRRLSSVAARRPRLAGPVRGTACSVRVTTRADGAASDQRARVRPNCQIARSSLDRRSSHPELG
jgi:hypothetical protein